MLSPPNPSQCSRSCNTTDRGVALEAPHVGIDEFDLETVVRGLAPRTFQIRARSINASDREPPAREFERMATYAAAEIENRLAAATAE